jgi:NAD(P)-dependent dehydrogenase (short-subunit alcohol dehydrogenase family)
MSKTAVIIGASGGIGAAFASLVETAAAYSKVYRFSRSENGGDYVDLTDEATLGRAAQQVQSVAAAPELIIIATGILHAGERRPERSMRELDGGWMAENFLINATGPALAAKHFIPLMPKTGRCVFAVLSARVGSISDNKMGGWYGYRASKAALNMIVRNLSIETQRRNPESIIVALHPGTVETALSAPFSGGGQNGERFTPQQSAAKLMAVLDELLPEDSGQIFDYNGQMIAP